MTDSTAPEPTPARPVPVGEERIFKAFSAGFRASERALGFEGCDESEDALAIEWEEYLATEAAQPSDGAGVPAGELVVSLRGIRSNFERIADLPPNDQPHYANGVRPWGTGDLRHAIETLTAAETALTATPPAPNDDLRAAHQAEVFAAAVAWLRERSAIKPPATLHHAAMILADQLEQSRIPGAALASERKA